MKIIEYQWSRGHCGHGVTGHQLPTADREDFRDYCLSSCHLFLGFSFWSWSSFICTGFSCTIFNLRSPLQPLRTARNFRTDTLCSPIRRRLRSRRATAYSAHLPFGGFSFDPLRVTTSDFRFHAGSVAGRICLSSEGYFCRQRQGTGRASHAKNASVSEEVAYRFQFSESCCQRELCRTS